MTTVEVQQENGKVIEINEKASLEQACINENEVKYNQTSNTICMREPLRTLLGKTGDTPFCEAILEGTATMPAGTPQYTKELFQQLKQSSKATSKAVARDISEQDFKDGWKVMKETTSSASLTGLHFGHLKACAMDSTLTLKALLQVYLTPLESHLHSGKKVS